MVVIAECSRDIFKVHACSFFKSESETDVILNTFYGSYWKCKEGKMWKRRRDIEIKASSMDKIRKIVKSSFGTIDSA